MDDNSNTIIEEDHEEIEEALSLCDFPLTNDEQDRQSSFETTDYFEFFTDFTQISHAEDIILSGKLIPLNQQSQSQSKSKSNSLLNQNQNPQTTTDYKLQSFHQRRSESLSELKSTRSNSTKSRLTRNSRSLDYRKLHRNSSMSSEVSPETRRNSSCRITGKSEVKVVKPRWYILTFGLVKFPPEIDLQDIKNRQVRRSNTVTLFPSFDAGNEVPVNRSERKCSSRLLRALSCKCRSSVDITASYPCIRRVEEVPITCHGT